MSAESIAIIEAMFPPPPPLAEYAPENAFRDVAADIRLAVNEQQHPRLRRITKEWKR